MAILSQTQKDELESKLQRFSDGVDVQKIDDVFDEIFAQLGAVKSISCTLSASSSLLIQADAAPLAEVCVPRAKNVLRLMCARLAVRCSEWAQREASPYHDSIEFERPDLRLSCRVRLENTPEVQRFEIACV
jgi:hypothetical protein